MGFHALFLIAMLSVPAAAEQTATAPAAPIVATPSSELDKIVCREGTAIPGSRFKGPRTCKTAREWEDIRLRARHDLAKTQIRGCSSGSCN